MARPLFSSSWHSVAPLKPKLLSQAKLERHVYRGQVWYVVSNQVAGKFYRLPPAAHALVTRMDGQATVQEIWDQLCSLSRRENAADRDIPTQDEVVNLLMQLHEADLLQPDVSPDPGAIYERYLKRRRQTWKQWLLNPMSLKVPLIDPDSFLVRWAHTLRWVFGPWGAVLWLAVVLPAILIAGQHYDELTGNLSDQILSSSNLVVLAAVFPVVKLLHELGHGFATRVWGGAVHEMGLMLLVFAPAPYVDASASSAFRSKWRRAIVGAAGMLVEVFVAALALFIWVLVEPGIVRAVAFNVMVVAGVSTIVINGNPLLRYDAYYILCDLIEMPNLGQRGPKYLTYLWNKWVFGATDQEPPAETASERWWLVLYTPISWCYRMFITFAIALFVAGEFFFFGVLLAAWSLVTQVGMPLFKATNYVLKNPTLQRKRTRALRTYGGLVGGILALVLLIPLPSRTQSEGVIWLPEQSILRAGANGFFARWLVEPGTPVQRGAAIALLEDPQLDAELAVAKARVAEARARLNAESLGEPAKLEISKRKLREEEEQLARVNERHAKLVVTAESDGTLTAGQPGDLPGRFFKKGELVGHVLDRKQLIARVVVQQADIDLVRTRYRSAELRLADSIADTFSTVILRETPGGMDELPTPALAISNGGLIATDPRDSNGNKVLERVFIFDMQLPQDVLPNAFGERVYVRFSHALEPLAAQGWRRLRQLFLSRFAV